MPELAVVATIAGVVLLVVLVAVFAKVRRGDLLGAIAQKRSAGSKLVSRVEYVEGVEKIPVVLSLTDKVIYYENPDLEASFELDRIDEIEYANELSTGRTIDDHCGVLRLRSHGAVFEFLLDRGDCAKWAAALPQRTLGGRAAQAV